MKWENWAATSNHHLIITKNGVQLQYEEATQESCSLVLGGGGEDTMIWYNLYEAGWYCNYSLENKQTDCTSLQSSFHLSALPLVVTQAQNCISDTGFG